MASDDDVKQAGPMTDKAQHSSHHEWPPQMKTGLMHRLLKLTNRLMTPFSAHLSEGHDISLNEFRMLMTLGRFGERASHELAEITGVNAMSVSRAVSALEKREWIAVRIDPQNRRRKWLALTGEGIRLYEQMRPESERVAEYLLSRLSGGDLEALDRIVETLIATLEDTDDEGRSLLMVAARPDTAGGSGNKNTDGPA